MSGFINFVFNFFCNMLKIFTFGKADLKHSLSIYIKTNTGDTLAVDLDPKWDIKNVKEVIGPRLGLDPDEMKIIFAGKELCDSTVIEVIIFLTFTFLCLYLNVINFETHHFL